MAEEADIPEAGDSNTGVDPTATALALAGASRERADAFLKKQEALMDKQSHHLDEQFKQLRLSIWQQRMGVLLRVATAAMGLAAACGIALVIWNAAHSNGLIVEPFGVPPDLAQKGLSGEVLASQFLDKLDQMSIQTTSYRTPRSFTNDWGNDVKVEIPDTGVSVGEAYQLLRNWLGHDIRISGEVYHAGNGIAVTVRSSGQASGTFNGTEDALDELIQKAAEHVYGNTQPYRYAGYLRSQSRNGEARTIYAQLTQEGSKLERSWAWIGLATIDERGADIPAVTGEIDESIALTPGYAFGYYYRGNQQLLRGQNEAALATRRVAARLLGSVSTADINSDFVPSMLLWNACLIAFYQGDYAAAVKLASQNDDLIVFDTNNSRITFRGIAALALALAHDPEGAHRIMPQLPPGEASPQRALGEYAAVSAPLAIEASKEEWPALLTLQVEGEEEATSLFMPVSGGNPDANLMIQVALNPWLGLAKAKLGDYAGAEALIGDTPADCYPCLRARARIAEAEGQRARADWWFARAVAAGPSLPLAETDWGVALLQRGKLDDAIEKFKLANQKGPHFADPLEGWGEALMKKNRSDLALAKFEEAAKYAPNWGGLHLKWGEALYYAGRRDEAAKQFAQADDLDLTPAEKADLAAMNHG